jgi:hypothetical protein
MLNTLPVMTGHGPFPQFASFQTAQDQLNVMTCNDYCHECSNQHKGIKNARKFLVESRPKDIQKEEDSSDSGRLNRIAWSSSSTGHRLLHRTNPSPSSS